MDNNSNNSACFSNCNYVNYYDTCWNAGPDERIDGIVNVNKNRWDCKPLDNGNSCETFNSDTDDTDANYGCFGQCFVQYPDHDNCGTISWFEDTQFLTPNEIEFKKKKNEQKEYEIPYKTIYTMG